MSCCSDLSQEANQALYKFNNKLKKLNLPTQIYIKVYDLIKKQFTCENICPCTEEDGGNRPSESCYVKISNVKFSGTTWFVELSNETTAPYLFLSTNTTEAGLNFISPTPSFPKFFTTEELFGVVTGTFEFITISASEIENPAGPEDLCANDSLPFIYTQPTGYNGDEYFDFPDFVNCTGDTTYLLLYSTADNTILNTPTGYITIQASAESVTYVGKYCDGDIIMIQVYDLPAPI